MIVVLITGGSSGISVLSDIDFTPDDWPDAAFLCQTVELDYTVHHTMVCKRQTIHTQLFSPSYQIGDTAHSIKETIFTMNMEMK